MVWNDLKVTNSFTLEMSMHAKESLMVNKRRKISQLVDEDFKSIAINLLDSFKKFNDLE